ncbi:MAG: large-conductance mechanosensitive channel protein MscL [Bacteroidetes bacterium]|nr:large-conductance mechanosensitive channel protein MscL [Bacteroidota bacterium]MBL0139261.1 large-conductance mechanosensitive channel protein MscL [Bacteroidota bacterium]
MGFLKEFKEFINKGNVVDLAVGVVIGGAFGKIVSSLVDDIVSPVIGLIIGQTDFGAWKLTMKAGSMGADGKEIPPVTMNVGSFFEAMIDFVIIAFVIFMIVKAVNRMKRKEAEAPSAPPAPTKDQVLLTEIRDLLKK